MSRKILIFILLIFISTMIFNISLKVGVYDDPPFVFMDKDTPRGIFIELINHIASNEGWNLIYIYDTWKNLLEKAKNGEIQILPDIAKSEDRIKFLDYTSENVIVDWGILILKDTNKLDNIYELNGKSISGLEKDIFTIGFENFIKKLGISVKIIYRNSFFEVIDDVRNGKSFAGIVNSLFPIKEKSIKKTNIIFQPEELYYAFPKNFDIRIRNTIDRYLRMYKADPNSIYWQILKKYVGTAFYEFKMPRWAVNSLILAFLTVIILLIFYIHSKLKFKTESSKLMEYLTLYSKVMEAFKIGFLIRYKTYTIYVNDQFKLLIKQFGIDYDSLKDPSDLIYKAEYLMKKEIYLKTKDIIDYIKDHIDKPSEVSKIWRKRIEDRYIEIRLISKKWKEETINIYTMRDVSEEIEYRKIQPFKIHTEISKKLTNILLKKNFDLKEVGENILETLKKFNLVNSFLIAILQENGDIKIPFGLINGEIFNSYIIEKEEKTLTRYIIDKGKTVYIPDHLNFKFDDKNYYIKYIGNYENITKTIFGVPIKVDDKIIGAVLFENDGYDLYDKELQGVFVSIVDIINLFFKLSNILKKIKMEKDIYKELSHKDPLTGVYNRKFLEVWLNDYFRSLQITSKNYTIAFLDIDNFKKINDLYGHTTGDRVLKEFVKITKSCIRENDIIIRYGGDEFILILVGTSVDKAKEVMKRIEKHLKKAEVMPINISWGISNILDAGSPEKAIELADKMMYQMKTKKHFNGGNE